MDISTLRGLAPPIQFERLQTALSAGSVQRDEALALAAEAGLPGDMQARLKGSNVVGVDYAEASGNATERAPRGEIVVGPEQKGLGKEVALKTGRPVVTDEVDNPNFRTNLGADIHAEGVRDLKHGHALYGRGVAACVLDVTNSVPRQRGGAFSGALRDATLAALEKAVLGRFRSAVGSGFREPVPSAGEWQTYQLGANLRVCDQFSKKLFIAGLSQKLEVLDQAGRVLECVVSLNGKIDSWRRNLYDEAGNLTRCVKIQLGYIPSISIYETGDKGFKSAVEANFYGDSSGTHVDITKQAPNGEWVQASYDNDAKYALDKCFHDRHIDADYGDIQRLDVLRLVDETPTGPDYNIQGPSSFQDAEATLYRGDKQLLGSWQHGYKDQPAWDRKVFRFHRNGSNIRAMTVRRKDEATLIVEHPGRGSKPEAASLEIPMRLSFNEHILPDLLSKALI